MDLNRKIIIIIIMNMFGFYSPVMYKHKSATRQGIYVNVVLQVTCSTNDNKKTIQ